ncbi:phosphoribosylformylglycinamidine synthase subunit PurQ [Pacificimonas flava]|uniref:Phosphoribosylformylglycinamidine synthase subunit PurQ n=1 Tax=Pacificimonas flava TaxID=1234595 RepID=M2TND8_9SPHN|nr:phosphoribosylformylglycinamidine synthase subunit PurQ [Pacificimonas flava]EMD83246.1 Phosphoribosylformylglycinamidine synthase, glutamine amidotransferase subunit [Pacificimonas flava]MBB5279191.1 phosphoribosylformylglycinamidine synthase [Pacificimonas flava]
MKSAVIVFPGSNCDRDMAVALERVAGSKPQMVWHGESELPDVDLIALPGGFSYGDYLRTGAIAANSPIMRAVKDAAEEGRHILGVCNGFQMLTEAGILPGALLRNAGLDYVCRDVSLTVENSGTPFTLAYEGGETIRIPVAHHDGNYYADEDTLNRLEDEGQIVFRYGEAVNGSQRNIAGIRNKRGNVLGMMPHPERLVEAELGGTDGRRLFEGLAKTLS